MWRQQICEWSYAVVDHFKLDREVVSVSMSYFDRFLSRHSEQVNRKKYQLAAMTCLFMAVKLYGTRKLSVFSLIQLSKGHFNEDHILTMERMILHTLSWNVHPPTPLSIVQHLILLSPTERCIDTTTKRHLNQVYCFLAELNVCDYFFVPHKSSSIALACILNAMDQVQVTHHMIKGFIDNVRFVTSLDAYSDEVEQCRAQLRELYNSSCGQDDYFSSDGHERNSATDKREVDVLSPVNVADYDQDQERHNVQF